MKRLALFFFIELQQFRTFAYIFLTPLSKLTKKFILNINITTQIFQESESWRSRFMKKA